MKYLIDESHPISGRLFNCLIVWNLQSCDVRIIPDRVLLRSIKNLGKKTLQELRSIVPYVPNDFHCPNCNTPVHLMRLYSDRTIDVRHPVTIGEEFCLLECTTYYSTLPTKEPEISSDYDHEACLAAMYPDFNQVSASPN